MRVVFMGTPEFAVPTLEILHNSVYDIAAVVTQPDRPKGRGQKLTASPVKEYACRNKLTVLQPEKVKNQEFIAQLHALSPDIIVVVAYGQILSEEILTLPRYGCINVHASLLPKYRGAAPIHWALINGETKTGVTTMHMAKGLDTGDMILKVEIPITKEDTTGSLHTKLSELGASLLLETVQQIAGGHAPREPQDDTLATYAPLLKREHEQLVWGKTAEQLFNQTRGLNPWPGAYTTHRGRKLKIWRVELVAGNQLQLPGTISKIDKVGIIMATGEGLLRILELQPENAKRMLAVDYARGHHLETGELMGV